MDFLVARLLATHVSHDDKALLNLVFSPQPTQAMLDAVMQTWDIEVMDSRKSLLLAYLMRERPDLVFSAHAGPRIKGLLTYFRFANMKTLAHFSKIGKALNAAHIPVLLFKGAAMKALRPALSRPMGDVDILVPKEHFARAVRIGEGLGYRHDASDARHAVDFHTDTEHAVDMHHALFEASTSLNAVHAALWQRASPIHAFGVQCFLPCHEDLFFLALANMTKNLREHTSLGNIYYTFCDSRFLQNDKPDFDWSMVWANAVSSDKTLEIRFAAEFINAIVPQSIPHVKKHFPLHTCATSFCNQVIFDEEVFLRRQRACQAIRVVDLKNHPWRYGKQIIKFLLLKKLRSVPAFVRWYLRTKVFPQGHPCP